MKHFTIKGIEKLFPTATTRSYPAGQIIVYEGDTPSQVFFVKSGAVKNYDIDENGNEKVLHLIGETNFLALLPISAEHTEATTFFSTLEDTELVLIPHSDFHRQLKTNLAFAHKLLGWCDSEMSVLTERIHGLEKTEGRLKVAQALRYLVEWHCIHKTLSWHTVKFPITQQLLADLVGLTRETVSMIMKDLDDQKVIRYPKQTQLEIHASRLRKICS